VTEKNMNLNKASLADVVHEVVGGPKAQAERAVDSVVDAIINTLKEGGEVSVAGFGIFSTKQRAARTARNPKTGEPVDVPAMRVPKFRPAKALKDAVR
jgi:DNA-binding protein HU-beta